MRDGGSSSKLGSAARITVIAKVGKPPGGTVGQRHEGVPSAACVRPRLRARRAAPSREVSPSRAGLCTYRPAHARDERDEQSLPEAPNSASERTYTHLAKPPVLRVLPCIGYRPGLRREHGDRCGAPQMWVRAVRARLDFGMPTRISTLSVVLVRCAGNVGVPRMVGARSWAEAGEHDGPTRSKRPSSVGVVTRRRVPLWLPQGQPAPQPWLRRAQPRLLWVFGQRVGQLGRTVVASS